MAQSKRKRAGKIKKDMIWSSFDDGAKAKKREKERARELRHSQWWKRQLAKGVCQYCGQETLPEELTMDHIVPIARGGKTTKGNVVCACKECNNRKKYLLPMEWEEYLQSMGKSGDNQ